MKLVRYAFNEDGGTIKLVIAVGSTTGTWKHYLRYKPLSPSSTVN